MAAFGIPDSVLIFTPIVVVNQVAIPSGAEVRARSHNKFTFDPGGEANYMMGASNLPIDIIVGTAKPKLEIDCGDGEEIQRILIAMGGIGANISVSLSFTKQDLPPVSLLFEPAVWKTGGGVDLSMDKGWAANKIEVMMTDVQQSINFLPFRSIYKKFAAT